MMKLTDQTVLITGGTSGIGWALAERFLKANNQVIICGRRVELLKELQKKFPQLVTIQCDVSEEKERIRLFETVTQKFPTLNLLVNNAGIQNRPAPLTDTQQWGDHRKELSTNLEAPMHLSMLFIKHLLKQRDPAIINVSSGLAFAPISFMPTYCATKAALHSFTLSLRHQLRNTSVRVVEIIPPSVNTDLGGKGLHDDGAPLDVFTDHVWNRLKAGDLEFGFGFSEKSRQGSRNDLDEIFKRLNP